MSEDILHFIWKFRLYNGHRMHTVSGQGLSIHEVGLHNQDAGPDFLNAKIRIGDTEWVGNVELHIRSSDWTLHKHQLDKAYNSVILHVVYEHDKAVPREDGSAPETLELKPILHDYTLSRYREMMSDMYWIPCEKLLHEVPEYQVRSWLSRLIIDRMETKVAAVYELLGQQKGDWEAVCHLWLARSFGTNINAAAFEQLARIVPLSLIGKHRHEPKMVTALFFGQAGFLAELVSDDPYAIELREAYGYLQKLHALRPMDASVWKFLRMRPANFPTIRIAQYAALVSKVNSLFSKMLDADEPKEIKRILETLPVDPYWETHYRFGEPSATRSPQLGEEAKDTIIINAVAVILFAYGRYIDKEVYIYRSIALLESLKPEKNGVIRRFAGLGVPVSNASDTQSLLQMKRFYCDRKKCLACSLGLHIIKQKPSI